MKRRRYGQLVVLLAAALAAAAPAMAQVCSLTEGFEGATFPPADWAVASTGASGSAGFQQGQSGTTGSHGDPHAGTYFAWHNDDNTSGDAIDWLVLPQIEVQGGNMSLTFWARKYYQSYYTYHGVWVSTGSGDPADGDYVELEEVEGGSDWAEVTIDLSPYQGQTIWLAFRYVGDWQDEWYLDDVSVDACGSGPSGADLSVTKSTTATGTVHPGDAVPFTIHVANAGPDDASNVTVTDTLPAGLDYDSCTGGCSYDAATRTVTWTLASLANGASQDLTLNTTVGANANGTLTNDVTVSGIVTDPDSTNNSASASVTAAPVQADLSVTKSTTVTDTVHPGDAVPFTIRVDNAGPDDATNVTVTDVLPTGLEYGSCTGGCTYDAATRTVTWTVATLASGAHEEWTLDTTVADGAVGEIANTVTAAADESDPDGANNQASAAIAADPRIPGIPATTPAGTLVLLTILAAAGLLILRRRV